MISGRSLGPGGWLLSDPGADAQVSSESRQGMVERERIVEGESRQDIVAGERAEQRARRRALWHETRVHMVAEQSSMITGEAQLVADRPLRTLPDGVALVKALKVFVNAQRIVSGFLVIFQIFRFKARALSLSLSLIRSVLNFRATRTSRKST